MLVSASEIIKIIDEKEMWQKTKTNKKKLRQKRTRGTEDIPARR